MKEKNKKNKKNNKETKRNIIKGIIFTAAIIVIGISASYAYFIDTIDSSKKTTLEAGTFEIDTNINSITAIEGNNLNLINASEKDTKAKSTSFYIKSTADNTLNANYRIYLTNVKISKNLYNSDFKWELLKNGTKVSEGNFSTAQRVVGNSEDTSNEADNVLTTAEDILLKDNLILSKDNLTGDTLVFRIWLQNNTNKTVNQIGLTNGSFSAKLSLKADPVSEHN